jgi:hypothetical protein
MIRGEGTQIAVGVLVLLFAAGSVSAVPTFPVSPGGADTLGGMTDSLPLDAVLIGVGGRDMESPALETLPFSVPQDLASLIAPGDAPALPIRALEKPVGDNSTAHGTTCPIPSPGTLLLGALGAFLVGALRMRRML